ncbi:site-specific integrase, partial [Nitrospiraceae bacterium AH_259_D15_M11_P09]|nr:site-specific integrase [Nitrospiraceae bacterium AH_259_D15_M11_P09]
SALKRIDVIEWHQAIGVKHPSQANQCLSQLRCMYNCAIDWGLHDGLNPVVRVKRYKLNPRERFVQPHEMGRLQAQLHTEKPWLYAYFSLILLCGPRRNEALNCRWEDLDFTTKLWRKHNTKIDQVQMVPVPVGLLTAIGLLPRCCEYVFHGGECGTHMSITNIEKHWRRIRRKVGIEDVRIHDLRRTCASHMAMNGENLSAIASVLGHTSLTHTGIYARLNQDAVRAALTRHAERIAAMPAEALDTQRGPAPSPAENSEGRPRGSESPRTWMGSAGNA